MIKRVPGREFIQHRYQKNKFRTVYKYKTHYRKHWNWRETTETPIVSLPLDEHIEVVNKFFPGFIIEHKVLKNSTWIDYNIVPGISAVEFPKEPEFIKKIYNFCLKNIEQTKPYAHFDWTLENIIINGDKMQLIDWDTCAIYTEKEVQKHFNSCYISQLYKKYV